MTDIITPVYIVKAKKEMTFKSSSNNSNPSFSKDTYLFCHRKNDIVYVYGTSWGTKLTVREARRYFTLIRESEDSINITKIKLYDKI